MSPVYVSVKVFFSTLLHNESRVIMGVDNSDAVYFLFSCQNEARYCRLKMKE